jgi:hypothetical protein
MPGMTGPGANDPALVSAFKAALLSQGSVALFIFVLLAFAWTASREALPASARVRLIALRASRSPEPPARRLLRIGFGLLWLFDGLLQAQPAMPGGLLPQVVAPAAEGSPAWVVHLVTWGAGPWSQHPVEAASGVVWLQAGIGLCLLSATRGRWSQIAGLLSAGWGLVVWVFGEAFGSIFAPGLSWLTGAPGAALLYSAAGLLVALPERRWQDPRLGRWLLRACGLLLAGLALLQAWPGRGFWQGRLDGHPGPLAAAVDSMAAMRQQPASLARLTGSFGSFVTDHGFAVNLVAVIVMAACGSALVLLTRRPAVVRIAVLGVIVFCLANWVLVQDFGFFGGIGTDPNSMVPFALLVLGGYLAGTRVAAVQPAAALGSGPAARALGALNGHLATEPQAPGLTVIEGYAAPQPGGPQPGGPQPGGPQPAARDPQGPRAGPRVAWQRSWQLVRQAAIALGTTSSSTVIALWAVGLVGLGTIPMAVH